MSVIRIMYMVSVFGLFGAVSSFSQTSDTPWVVLHHDERHTGIGPGIGKFPMNVSPTLQWSIQAFPSVTSNGTCGYRFYSGFPLADLDGDSNFEVIVTGPDNTATLTCSDPAASIPELTNGLVCAIRTVNNHPEFLWRHTFGTVKASGSPQINWGCSDWFDQYSAAVINCDSNPLPDVVFTSKGGMVRAISGLTGDVVWEYQTGGFIEAGPMIGDLDRDGTNEVIVLGGAAYVDTCDGDCCQTNCPYLYIFQANPSSLLDGITNEPIRTEPFPAKLDSNEPALVDLDPTLHRVSKTIVFGSWGSDSAPGCPGGCSSVPESGFFYALWFDLESGTKALTNADIRVNCLSLLDLAAATGDPPQGTTPIVRSSPLVWDFGTGETAVFGWMWNYNSIESSRISAVGLEYFHDADPTNREVLLSALWTVSSIATNLGGTPTNWPVMDWKPSVALLPISGSPPLIVSAGGKGINGEDVPVGGETGNYGLCNQNARGWVGAFDINGSNVWSQIYTNEGNIRASCAVGDLDADGRYEVVVPFGCRGKVRCYDGENGQELWNYQLGDPTNEWTQRSIGSPSIGDVTGDGLRDVIVSAFDGKIYCLGSYALEITNITKNSNGYFPIRWTSYGGTRYRLQYTDGTAGGGYDDIFHDLTRSSAEETDTNAPRFLSSMIYTDDFALAGALTNGARYYRVREISP